MAILVKNVILGLLSVGVALGFLLMYSRLNFWKKRVDEVQNFFWEELEKERSTKSSMLVEIENLKRAHEKQVKTLTDNLSEIKTESVRLGRDLITLQGNSEADKVKAKALCDEQTAKDKDTMDALIQECKKFAESKVTALADCQREKTDIEQINDLSKKQLSSSNSKLLACEDHEADLEKAFEKCKRTSDALAAEKEECLAQKNESRQRKTASKNISQDAQTATTEVKNTKVKAASDPVDESTPAQEKRTNQEAVQTKVTAADVNVNDDLREKDEPVTEGKKAPSNIVEEEEITPNNEPKKAHLKPVEGEEENVPTLKNDEKRAQLKEFPQISPLL